MIHFIFSNYPLLLKNNINHFLKDNVNNLYFI